MSSYCKFYKEKRQVSYDNGITFIDVTPAEYRKGELIERDSPDCGYVPPTPPASGQYLTFVAIDSGTFSFSGSSSGSVDNSSIQYSLDSGSTWYTLNRNVQSPTISAGEKIMWKSTSLQPLPWSNGIAKGIGNFSSTGRFNVEGNVMSLLYGDNFGDKLSLSGKNGAFGRLFINCNGLISAENLILPATTLSDSCYHYMFEYCTSLTTAPELPATTLVDMCYYYMFYGCTSLTTAPALPATTLTNNCYAGMFYGCSSLTTAPVLPATTLATYCYIVMFAGCTSLNYIKCLATDISATDCTTNWLDGVSSSGTFVKNASTTWPTGANGIPSGWTVQNA